MTGDHRFGNRIKFNPADYSGIVLIRVPSQHTLADWREAIEALIEGLEAENAVIEGKLWVIQHRIIQEYEPIEPDKTND